MLAGWYNHCWRTWKTFTFGCSLLRESEAMFRRPLWTIAVGAAVFAAAATAASPASADQNPYGDPNLVSMFDGSTLTGWTASKPGAWVVQGGAIHGTGTRAAAGATIKPRPERSDGSSMSVR
jgi:hypothetical protein